MVDPLPVMRFETRVERARVLKRANQKTRFSDNGFTFFNIPYSYPPGGYFSKTILTISGFAMKVF
jgi:hypothetical protein